MVNDQAASVSKACPKAYTRSDARRVFRRTFDGQRKATQHERRTLRRVVRCQQHDGVRKRVRAKRKRARARHLTQLEHLRVLRSLTPYDCGAMGRWAIPCYIIACESGFSWGAYNPSGAAGPYQLMAMHGRPFPVVTLADRLEHHRLAAMLWRGGAGRSHWVC